MTPKSLQCEDWAVDAVLRVKFAMKVHEYKLRNVEGKVIVKGPVK